MRVQVIKNTEQHEVSLAEVDRLIMLDPEPGSEEADKLAALAVLVEKYEKNNGICEQIEQIEQVVRHIYRLWDIIEPLSDSDGQT